ncbi:hypothetical protein F4813DRAFT_398287 [Daldinia decipiens]|uniref:uncharacterized protein n=1 Tax=Daldinia decipiens TaxID=326647 RepID=UPI0020C2E190|nr:uncharacterized protein F4813DRAFT_398287 [Daldinia decipiens]KAI1661715.1 hypothetical protein F4813DRAFT_398287 [Daldinia decipiens]
MSSAHEAFKALGPINWDDVPQDRLDTFFKDACADAQCIIDSIPVSSSSLQHMGLPRSATDTNLTSLPNRDSNLSDRAAQLRKEWKECKINPRENPLGLDVYKLAAKDGKGAWFARRSVHDGFTFEKWKLGLEKEFDESLKVEGGPGAGSIRGIGADRKIVSQTVEGIGKMRVYQLSAQFPGPTAPRDFIGLLLSSESVTDAPGTPRHFMLVSKPCVHPECPPRQGYIRGQYESVEFIREIRVEKPLRKTRSSIDLPNDEVVAMMRKTTESLSREATVRSARQAAEPTNSEGGRKRGKTIGSADVGDDREEDDHYETMIEWLMVTRSDPGGSVPRFMIERGTPPGIAGDANKLVKWISSKSIDYFADSESESNSEDAKPKCEISNAERVDSEKTVTANFTSNTTHHSKAPRPSATRQMEEVEEQPGSVGVYGMIANALNAAASAAASRIPNPFGPVNSEDADTSDLTSENREDDSSSIHSFHSLEGEGIAENDDASQKPGESSTQLTPSVTNGGAESTVSSESLTTRSIALSHHEKELRKLEERKRKTEEKLQRAQERALAKRGNGDTESQREEAAMQKLREKHEREIAKQQEKYQREITKLEAKRASEQKKAEERRRKALEREEKTTLAMELDKMRAERDIAHKQMEILKEQIGELQAQNTKLVARLGREGINVDDSDGSSSFGGIKRSMTDQMSDRDSRRESTLRL